VEVARKTSTVIQSKLPPSFNRSHPLPSGGCCEEDYHRLASGGSGRRWMWRGRLPPSFNRSHRCQAVDVARKTTTVWRAVATGGGGCGEEDYHRHSIVATAAKRWRWRGRLPPSFNRSHPLPSGGCGEENYHRLANGGYGRRWMWRGRLPPSFNRSHPLPSGGCCEEGYHRHSIVATRCQAVDVARKTTTVIQS